MDILQRQPSEFRINVEDMSPANSIHQIIYIKIHIHTFSQKDILQQARPSRVRSTTKILIAPPHVPAAVR